ncbi:MAG: selenide, water dikinase SelD, partial [Flavobacteriales bacterium]
NTNDHLLNPLRWRSPYRLVYNKVNDEMTEGDKDARAFGKIAAANALSDVYAMGGKPIAATAILGWPVSKLSTHHAQQVLEGARLVCSVAGIQISGGHSIESPEPFFGLNVNGLVKREHLKRNGGARPGDLIFLTKPLGNGIMSTAAKRGVAVSEDLESATRFMCTLNQVGEALGKQHFVTSMTDVTGFGLIGHLLEMCDASKTSAELNWSQIPRYPFLKKYTDQFIYPDMTTKNHSAFSSRVSALNAEQMLVLNDPQTSGGLLVTIEKNSIDEFRSIIGSFNILGEMNHPMGQMITPSERAIEVHS